MDIGVAVVGLGFGTEFLPIYLSHPNVGYVAIADSDPLRLAEVGARYGVEPRASMRLRRPHGGRMAATRGRPTDHTRAATTA